MIESTLQRRLSGVATRVHRLRLLRRQTITWLIVLLPAVILCVMLPEHGLPLRRESIALTVAVTLGLVLARWNARVPTWLETALLVEQHHPELNDVVLTAVRQEASAPNVSSVLTARVLRQADDAAMVSNWTSVVPRGQIFRWFLASGVCFGLLVSSVLAAGRWRFAMDPTIRKAATEDQALVLPFTAQIEPGDTEVERGTELTVVARFSGEIPTYASVQVQYPSNASPTESATSDEKADIPNESLITLSMKETVDDGVFAVRIPSVQRDARYAVHYDFKPEIEEPTVRSNVPAPVAQPAGVSDEYLIQTFVLPRVVQVDADIIPPDWTGRGPTKIKDTLRLVAIEGSDVRLQVHLNKPVAQCFLESDDGKITDLTSTEPLVFNASLRATINQTWTIRLKDHKDRVARDDAKLSLRIVQNTPPTIQIMFPQPDISVSALQELVTDAEATDDFGIVDSGIIYSLSGGNETTVSFLPSEEFAKQVAMSHMIDLETLEAAPHDLLSWYFYADTYSANGQVIRTVSDLMFADVRRFEEIFREEQQPGSRGRQQDPEPAGQTDALLQIQRQITLSLWNVQRDTTGTAETDEPPEKRIATITESQELAVTQLDAMKQQQPTDDPDLLEAIDRTELAMNEVLDALSLWSAASSEQTLSQGITASQAAFQQLLRLRSEEHRIMRDRNQQGSPGGQNSAMQQQLDQLELDNERNRYETERQAQQQQSNEHDEQLQILNRLKELARRQNLLNERLQELGSELRQANTEEERGRLERELKRLRDEQREMLRDVDELREQMDQSSHQQDQKQEKLREDVDRARENVRRASQAADQGQLSKALSEGTRAERQFDQLKQEFRRQTSSVFSEAARDLRQQARKLEDRQEDIARTLSGDQSGDAETARQDNDEIHRRPAPSLRSEQSNDKIREQLKKQQDELENLLQQSKALVEQSENSEPLLARELFETVRKVEDLQTHEALRAAEFLAERGLWEQVPEPEQAARRGIQRLREGIEKAAEAVLGSKAEALKQAKQTLDKLTEELSSEVDDATRDESSEPPASPVKTPSTADDPEQQQKQQQDSDRPSTNNSQQEKRPDSNDALPLRNSRPQQSAPPQTEGASDPYRPLTGVDFRRWSNGLREVEEVLDDPELQHRVAQIRDRAKAIRADFRRHGTEPQWDLVRSGVLEEMKSLQRRLIQDIKALKSDRSIAPIDREPVPDEFDELVRRYYELLGQEQKVAPPQTP